MKFNRKFIEPLAWVVTISGVAYMVGTSIANHLEKAFVTAIEKAESLLNK
jgi:hypothetical protein